MGYSFKFKTEKVKGMLYENYLGDIVDEFEHEANTILNELVEVKNRLDKLLDDLEEKIGKVS